MKIVKPDIKEYREARRLYHDLWRTMTKRIMFNSPQSSFISPMLIVPIFPSIYLARFLFRLNGYELLPDGRLCRTDDEVVELGVIAMAPYIYARCGKSNMAVVAYLQYLDVFSGFAKDAALDAPVRMVYADFLSRQTYSLVQPGRRLKRRIPPAYLLMDEFRLMNEFLGKLRDVGIAPINSNYDNNMINRLAANIRRNISDLEFPNNEIDAMAYNTLWYLISIYIGTHSLSYVYNLPETERFIALGHIHSVAHSVRHRIFRKPIPLPVDFIPNNLSSSRVCFDEILPNIVAITDRIQGYLSNCAAGDTEATDWIDLAKNIRTFHSICVALEELR